MALRYDAIVVGAGPAGIFCAREMSFGGARVALLEKGSSIDKRNCPGRKAKCTACKTCAITCGWGGAGAFSDGKLTLTPNVGGWLPDYMKREKLEELIKEVDKVYLDFGAPEKLHGTDDERTRYWQKKATLADLTLTPIRIRHMGTDKCRNVLGELHANLEGKIDMMTDFEVETLIVEGKKVTGIVSTEGETMLSDNVILAVGREGSSWLMRLFREMGLVVHANLVDLGLRVEVASALLEPLTMDFYEPKLSFFAKRFEDRVRTFCMNPYGEVCTERYGDVLTVNGHSYSDMRTELTNFAILVSTTFTKPFNDPISYGMYIARLANLLGDGIIVQRLGDLLQGRRSTYKRISRSVIEPSLKEATPGDLSFVLPYRYISDILEMIEAMDKLVEGLYSRNTLLYGVEVKFYSSRPNLNPELMSEIEGLFCIGDGAGVTRGLIQASVSGVVAARAVLNRLRTDC